MRVVTGILLALALGSAARAHDPHTRLPLGDGKLSAEPRRGYMMACQTRFGGGGAFRIGEWIGDKDWDPDGKPVVEGQVDWPNARIAVSVEGDKRVVRANNLPLHPSGEFPVKAGTRAYDYDRNPNHIGEQPILLTLPARPEPAATAHCVPMGMIGFALSGVAIFNAVDAQGRDAPAYEIQDSCNGHPERSSQYHYHNWSPCLAGRRADEPVGWMLDGFPILGPLDPDGHEITNAELDDCHGRVGPVRIGGKTLVTYHYRFTLEYPYTIGCFRGAPVTVPRPRGFGPGRPPPRDGGRPPG